MGRRRRAGERTARGAARVTTATDPHPRKPLPLAEVAIRRSELTVPGHLPDLLRKAAASQADEVMLDCEDACPVSAKGEEVRRTIVAALNSFDWGGKALFVRPNGRRTVYGAGDLEHIVSHAVDRFHGIIMPKVLDRDDIAALDETLTRLEDAAGWSYRLQIEALIETARGVENAFRIAEASPRVSALIFGIADYSADMGMSDPMTNQNQRFVFAKQRVVNAAKACGLDAIDNAHLHIRDLDGLREAAETALSYGFDGKWALSPTHVPVINAVFSPPQDQLARAEKVARLYAQADREEHLGALLDPDTGELLDEATIKIAARLLQRGVRAGLVSPDVLAQLGRA
jgi:citrate lyase subunit beta/citryl-CoA lyase